MKKTLTLLMLLLTTSIATALTPVEYEALKKEYRDTDRLAESTYRKLTAHEQGNANMLQHVAISVLEKVESYAEEKGQKDILEKIKQFNHHWNLISTYDNFAFCLDVYFENKCEKTYLKQLQEAAHKFHETFLKDDSAFSYDSTFAEKVTILSEEHLNDFTSYCGSRMTPVTKIDRNSFNYIEKQLVAFGEKLKKTTRYVTHYSLKEILFPEFMNELEAMMAGKDETIERKLKDLNIRYAKARLYEEETLHLLLKRESMALRLLHHDFLTRDEDDKSLVIWTARNIFLKIQRTASTLFPLSQELKTKLLDLSQEALGLINAFEGLNDLDALERAAQKTEIAAKLFEDTEAETES